MIVKWFHDNIYQPIKNLFSSNRENDIAQVTIHETDHNSIPTDTTTDIDFLIHPYDDII